MRPLARNTRRVQHPQVKIGCGSLTGTVIIVWADIVADLPNFALILHAINRSLVGPHRNRYMRGHYPAVNSLVGQKPPLCAWSQANHAGSNSSRLTPSAVRSAPPNVSL
jgi:hypothetical protein